MVFDSFLITLSLLGLAFGPLWAWLWTKALRRIHMSRARRAASVVGLSLATLAVVCIGPLAVLAVMHGLMDKEGSDLNSVATLALFCFPGLAVQIGSALGFALNEADAAAESLHDTETRSG